MSEKGVPTRSLAAYMVLQESEQHRDLCRPILQSLQGLVGGLRLRIQESHFRHFCLVIIVCRAESVLSNNLKRTTDAEVVSSNVRSAFHRAILHLNASP